MGYQLHHCLFDSFRILLDNMIILILDYNLVHQSEVLAKTQTNFAVLINYGSIYLSHARMHANPFSIIENFSVNLAL